MTLRTACRPVVHAFQSGRHRVPTGRARGRERVNIKKNDNEMSNTSEELEATLSELEEAGIGCSYPE
ncbi:hypothetical protein Y032_0909g2995 [Ancylostoma ceylanicum]|uniref:Uncharacterized protein n=1 Tax=Ancylostoma ceylanicum TaxID=53326 RepID=A0A016W9M3_9BILA|nr:hypothetical protein Y032_0909g2995 [Ancylostoma ceylanicum]